MSVIPNDFERVNVPFDWDYVEPKAKVVHDFEGAALSLRVGLDGLDANELLAARLSLRTTLNAIKRVEKINAS